MRSFQGSFLLRPALVGCGSVKRTGWVLNMAYTSLATKPAVNDLSGAGLYQMGTELGVLDRLIGIGHGDERIRSVDRVF